MPEALSALRGSMIAGITWTAVDQWANRLLSLTVVAVLARLLDRTEFGLVAAAAVWIDYFGTYVGQGLGLAIIQRKELEPEHLNAVFWINMLFAVVLTGLTWVAAPLLAALMKYPEIIPVVRWLSLGLILQAFSRVHIALLTRNMRFAPIAAVNVIASVSGAVSALSLAFFGWGVWSLVAQQLIGGAGARIAVWWIGDWKPGMRFTWAHLRDLYGYSLYVFVDQQVLFMARRLDEALIGAFMGVADLGLYSIAKRLVLLLQEVLEAPLAQVLFPGLSRLQGSIPNLSHAADMAYRFVCLVVTPLFAGLFALAPEAVRIAFGPNWGDAPPLVRVLSIGAPFFIFPLIIHATFHALGQPRAALIVNTARAFVGAIILPIGTLFGPLGIPASVSLRNGLGVMGDLHLLRKSFPFIQISFVSGLARPLCCSLVVALVARLVADRLSTTGYALSVILPIFFAIAFYIGLMFLFDRPLMVECLKIIREALHPALSRCSGCNISRSRQ